jgi:hypothetical protein
MPIVLALKRLRQEDCELKAQPGLHSETMPRENKIKKEKRNKLLKNDLRKMISPPKRSKIKGKTKKKVNIR